MRDYSTTTGTIGATSAAFIRSIRLQGKAIFDLDVAMKLYGKSRHDTSEFLKELVNRGVIARIRPGLFLLLEPGQENTQLLQWPIIARELANKKAYYISHYSAMRLHGMTTHPLFSVFITMTKRHKTLQVPPIMYQFIYSKPKHFWGGKKLWVSKHEQVMVSDLERTILDGLDRPELCGGIKEVVQGIWAKRKEINSERLVDYSKKFRSKAVIKRLGFLLELLELYPEISTLLLDEISDKKDYILLDPSEMKSGKYLKRWRIQININTPLSLENGIIDFSYKLQTYPALK